MNEIEEIKQRLNIVDLIGQYVSLKKAGANYKAICPFHQEKTPSLMVSPEKQIWRCFGCGKGGSVFDFVMEAESLEFGDALKLLAQKAGVILRPRTQAEHQTRSRKERLFQLNGLIAKIYQKILWETASGKPAQKYLKNRGVSDKTLKDFMIGFAPRNLNLKNLVFKHGFLAGELAQAGNPEKFFDRVMFPVFDVLGNVIGFTGRSLNNNEPKYLNSPETPVFNKSRVLYGLNFAKGAIKEKDFVVLVEGQMDVIMLHQAGVTQSVAASGTAVTESHIQILSKYTPNFMLAFDNDEAGRTATRKIIELLLTYDLNGRVIDFSPYKDASELLQKEPKSWPTRLKNALEMIDWLISEQLVQAGELRFIENKKKVIRTLLPYLKLINEPTRLDLSLQRLALAVGVKLESLYAALKKVKPDAVKPVGALSTRIALTNEEQLLALIISKPHLAPRAVEKLGAISWQSEQAQRFAKILQRLYTDKVLTKNQSVFVSQVKSQISPAEAGRVDSMLFWVESNWPNLKDELASELIKEKLAHLTMEDYERQKSELARQIRLAQESGDLKTIKGLMEKLNKLTRKK